MASSNQGKDQDKQQDSKAGKQVSAGSSKQGATQSNKQSGDTSNRGFASMDPARQRAIAAEGGRAAHQKGTAHEFTSEEARRAGSMSHKNDQNSQSAAAGSASRGGNTGNNTGSNTGGNRGNSGGTDDAGGTSSR